jgi:short-subunit dehydrogenase
MQVNLLAPMALSALLAKDMIARRQGHIVNISSLAGWVAPKGLAHYSASKFGLRGFSEGLLDEVKAYNVKVTAVYPYFSRTPILNSPQYGTLAQTNNSFLARSATDPADIIKETLKAIIRDRPAVFPDATAKQVYFLKRYFPRLLDLLAKN